MINPTASHPGGQACRGPANARWDVVVIGAGPAGAASALRLARGGLAVLLVDKADWPRSKVCGGCLNRAGLAALKQLDAMHAIGEAERGPVLRSLRLRVRRAEARIPLAPGRAVERAAFDAALVRDAVEAGACFMPSTAATIIEPGHVLLEQRHTDRPKAPFRVAPELVIVATGLQGVGIDLNDQPRTGSRIGVGAVVKVSAVDVDVEPGVIAMACGGAGYVGMTPLADHRLDIAAALTPSAVRAAGGVAGALRQTLADAGVESGGDLAGLKWQGTPALTRRVARPWGERLLAVGDAAGYVEPFTGEGMAWALAGGAALGETVLHHGGRWHDALGPAWAATHRRLIHRRHARCRIIARALRHPALCAAAVRAIGCVPVVARPLVRAINRPMSFSAARPVTAFGKG